jgi:hypothetical protein
LGDVQVSVSAVFSESVAAGATLVAEAYRVTGKPFWDMIRLSFLSQELNNAAVKNMPEKSLSKYFIKAFLLVKPLP